jgi:DNA end-binding protein Ku
MLRPVEGGLVMQQLLYADEVRPISEIGLDKEKVQDAELKLATMLIEQRAVDKFRPEEYEDEVKKRIQEQLKKKIETGEEISSAPAPAKGEVIDLMEALRRSLGKSAPVSRKPAAAASVRKPAKPATRGVEKEKKAASRR